jgi:hypothetical protein
MEEPDLVVWWSSAVAVQAGAANHPELLRSRAVVDFSFSKLMTASIGLRGPVG